MSYWYEKQILYGKTEALKVAFAKSSEQAEKEIL